jgi:uncharacterized protein YlaI
VCRRKEAGVQDTLIEQGWQGVDGKWEQNKFRFDFCPDCKNKVRISEILTRIQNGELIYRNKNGDYEELKKVK